MPRHILVAIHVLLPVLLWMSPVVAQVPDTLLARIARLVTTGDRQGARAAADSLLKVASPASPVYAEGLYWRAFTAANAAEAERDYLRLAIEYPLAPRSEDALLLLSQLEFARGDRASALRHLDRLVRDHPSGRNIGRASFWTSRIAFETGDTIRACEALARARAELATDDVETRNQVDYYAPRCSIRAQARSDSTVKTAYASEIKELSLQVAAYKTTREAQDLAKSLKSRGFDARVSHVDTWYRVRIGRYSSRIDAQGAQKRAKNSSVATRIVEAEPR